MFSMRSLLGSDPLLPAETREAIAHGDPDASDHLVRLGANHCEAAELLDRGCGDTDAARDPRAWGG